MLGQGAVIGTGLAAARMLDQQSEYSQPMSSGVGNADLDNFLMSQQLQNQKFMHDMALVQKELNLEFQVLNIPDLCMEL